MAGLPGMPGLPGGRKAKRQQSQGKKTKKGPGRAGGGPSKPKALPAGDGLQLPPGLAALPPTADRAPATDLPPDPFGLRRPR